MIYYSSKELFDFKTFKTKRFLGEDIYSGKTTINKAVQEQGDLLEYISNFNNKARPRKRVDKKKFKNVFNTVKIVMGGRALVINGF